MSIYYHDAAKIFELKTGNMSYILGINRSGGIQCLYWGDMVNPEDCTKLLTPVFHSGFDPNVEKEREEYNPWGGLFYAEPSLRVTFADGVRDIKMAFQTYSINESRDELVLTLRDLYYPLKAELAYKLIEEFDLIERRCTIRNTGEAAFSLENVCSAVWNIPDSSNYRMTYVSGKWAGESRIRRCGLSEGKVVIESRRGFTSSSHNPWFAVDNGFADEEYGKVWFGALAWSGNWKITAEKTSFNHVRVVGGINDFDFFWELNGGESFETPVFTGGYTHSGFGGMSRNLHAYQRTRVLPGGNPEEVRKILYNSWEATGFNVKVDEQIELAEKAAKLGVELFVVDDGWFGSRDDDTSGLGDWIPNMHKFPEGLTPLISKVNMLGMDFGIWVEPEMVNPDSNLYRVHPDWVYAFPNRPGSLGRNQLVLNLSKQEVKEFIIDFMTALLSKNNIKFIKWDMNRPFSEPGWADVPEKRQKEIWVRHIKNLYYIWNTLRERFPEVRFESCAGGGGRIDLGIMRYADQFWVSDNTDAYDRLSIQEGYSYAYCPKAMMCWVTDSPNGMNGRRLSVKYRFLSAMMGSLGIGGNLTKWTEEELDEAAGMVMLYKEIRHLVQNGKQYRISSPETGNTIVQYTDQKMSEIVVFVLNHSQQFGESQLVFCLKGLEPDRTYRIRCEGEETFDMSGRGLMNVGLAIPIKGDFDCTIIRIAG